MTVMIVGFSETTIRGLKDAGVDISLAIYIHKIRKPIEGVELLSHRALHHMMEDQFAPTLDEGIARQVRQRALPYYRRTHHRHFRRRGGSKSWIDVENYFENALQYFWNMLSQHSVDKVLFHNVPAWRQLNNPVPYVQGDADPDCCADAVAIHKRHLGG